MKAYKVFVNGKQQGEIRAHDIDEALKDMYGDMPITYTVDKSEKAIYIRMSILDVMQHVKQFENK